MEQSGTAYYGRLRKADEISQHAAASAAQAGAPQRGAEWKATEALRAAKVGETTRALKLAQDAASLNPREEARGIVGGVRQSRRHITRTPTGRRTESPVSDA